MIKNQNASFPQEIYLSCLKEIGGIRFTPREVDVISFMISGRGTKKTAAFFSLSPKTIESCTRNIMIKLECSARDNVVDFVERSGKFQDIKRYYASLLVQNCFEACLKDISLVRRQERLSLTLYLQEEDAQASFFQHLAKHLKIAGLKVSLEIWKHHRSFFQLLHMNSRRDFTIYFMSNASTYELQPQTSLSSAQMTEHFKNVLLVFSGDRKCKAIPHSFTGFDCLELDHQKNYYDVVFAILQKVLPIDFAKFRSGFEEKQITLQKTSYLPSTPTPLNNEDNVPDVVSDEAAGNSQDLLNDEDVVNATDIKEDQNNAKPWNQAKKSLRDNRTSLLLLLLPLFLIGTSGYLIFLAQENKRKLNNENSVVPAQSPIRSDLMIPAEPVFLNRARLLAQIDDQFNKQNEKIRTIVLFGIGGSGKTTLARQYACQQKDNTIWEINAETKDSLQRSFEELAQALSATEEDKKILRGLQEIRNPIEKKEEIMNFVKKRLKLNMNWILIYDNVERFSDVQECFPTDPKDWGNGRIIITTQDTNFQNNNLLNYIISVKDLDFNEKLNIFLNIMRKGENGENIELLLHQKDKFEEFLKEIPPFPLDVSLAAYYIKSTHIPYEKYIEYLKTSPKDFIKTQENILNDVGTYKRTRDSIIILSLKKLMDTHKDFCDLFLLMSLLDSQHIPRDLLDRYKNNAIVDNFIYNLKKYSLVINEHTSSFSSTTLSMHRSTQNISLAYLIKTLNLENNKTYLNSITKTLEAYVAENIKKEDVSRMNFLISHLECFLSHGKLLKNEIKSIISGYLGGMYSFTGDYLKAQALLECALKHLTDTDHKVTAQFLFYLGNIYEELGHYQKAKNTLEEALSIYQKYFSSNYEMKAEALTQLAVVNEELGNYEEAKNLLEKSLNIYQSHYPNDYINISRVLTSLGDVNMELGNYEKARILLEESIILHKKYYPKNHVRIAWALLHLGNTYKKLGNHVKSKDLLEESLHIYKALLCEDHPRVAWVLAYLGDAYRMLGDYQKAKNILEESLKIHYKHYQTNNNIDIAWILRFLGRLYTSLGDYKKAQSLFSYSLPIYEQYYGKNHLETADLLRSMGYTSLIADELETSSNLLHNSLEIYNYTTHPEKHRLLEDLAELNLRKSISALRNRDQINSQKLREESISYLKQALKIVQTSFPEDSPHRIRIQTRLAQIR